MKKDMSDEKPKNEVALKVITPKRKYFVPSAQKSVEASTLAEALKKVKTKEEEGDVDS